MTKDLTVFDIENARARAARYELPDARIRGLRLIVQPSGKKSWAVRRRLSGKPSKFTIGSYPAIGLAEARAAALEALASIARGIAPSRAGKDAGEPAEGIHGELVADVVELFITRYVQVKTRRGLAPKASSVQETSRILRREIIPAWGQRPVAEIGVRDVHQLLDKIAARAPITANQTLAAVRSMFNWAVKRGLVSSSPCSGIEAPSATRERERVLTDPELARVWQAAGAVGFPYGDIVKLMILTGARRSEIADMPWSELEFETGVWTLPAARSKNHQPLKLPLPALAREILAEIPRIAGQELIFSGNGRTPVAAFSRAKKFLEAALPAPIPDWRCMI